MKGGSARLGRIVRTVTGALALGLALAGPARAAPAVSVVASFSIVGDVVKQVGGDRVELRVLVGPGADAHVYQPTPAQARVVASAQLLFSNGLGYEGWLARFLRAAGFKGRHVVLAEGFKVPPAASGAAGPGGRPREGDPHVWQNVASVMRFAERVAAGLCAVDFSGCVGHRERAAAYIQRLAVLDGEIRQGWAQVPKAQRKLIVSHSAFAHYAAAYEVQILAPQGASTEAQASARGVAALVRQIKAEGVRAVFVENIADPRLVEQVARETGLRVAGSLFSDALSDAEGPAPTYEAMMRHNTAQMLRAVRHP